MALNRLDEEVVDFLCRPRRRWVDISVEVGQRGADGSVCVTSRHVAWTGQEVQHFSTRWPDPDRVDSEYGWGIGLIHDVKDHVFYGLGLTDLSEFQTIVQTYYGREVAGGESGRAPDGDYLSRILSALKDELYGPRGPRVYGTLETGLFDLHAPGEPAETRAVAFVRMYEICTQVMLPPLRAAYARNPLLRRLQASTRDQPLLVERFLGDVRWRDPGGRLLRLSENTGLRLHARAYIDDDLAGLTGGVRGCIHGYSGEHEGLLERFGPIFDVTGYLAPWVEQASAW